MENYAELKVRIQANSGLTSQSTSGVGRRVASRGSNIGFGRLALIAGLFTASFDIFLVVDVGGFTLRIHQVFLAISTLTALQLTYSAEKIKVPLGATWLILWTLFIFAFVPHTSYLARSIGYAFWLLLDVLIVFVTVQLFGNKRWIEVLLRGYLGVFLGVGCLGVLQMVLGIMRIPDPFVKQWVIVGALPRVNGFSYEPSYYSTYMLIGWVFAAWLIEHETYVLGKRLIRATFFVASLAMLLSTSRLGWAMMGLWGVGFVLRRLRQRGPVKLSPTLIILGMTMIAMATVWMARGNHLKAAVSVLAGGTGLAGTPAHSVDDRENNLLSTLFIIKKSPLVGYSLGGVATAIGVAHGLTVKGNADAKQSEGGTVFAEVLAASGVIGIIPFALYLFTIIRRPILIGRNAGGVTGDVLSGLVWALCMELVVLQFNQNILRAYLWFHLAVLSSAYAAISNDGWRATHGPVDIRT